MSRTVLGRGGMGVVVLAVRNDDELAKRVAIKLIRRGVDSTRDADEVVRRFELERQVLCSLNHPNIARVLDAGRTEAPDSRPFFVMEYVEGEQIDEYCDHMELSTAARLRLFQKVCAAVHHAHQNLVVHRDIKPSNILVDASGEPKLMDFGIVKLLNQDMAGLTMATSMDRGPMTPEYASPEQVQGRPISTSSDVYALGVLLYELLTGRRPYRLKSRAMETIVRAICEDEPERPSAAVSHEDTSLTSDGKTTTKTAESLAKPREGAVARLKRRLAGDLDNIVLLAMRKSPQRRYASAQAFADDIQRHLDGQPVKARPETWVYVAGKFARRNRVGVTVGVVAAIALVGASIVTTLASRRASAERDNAAKAQANAEAQQALAEKRLTQVRELAATYMTDLQTRLKKKEGSTEARSLLAETSLQLIEKLASEFPDDQQLKRQLATGYVMAANARGGKRGESEGKPEDATDPLRKAIAIRRDLLGKAPGDDEIRRELTAGLLAQCDLLHGSADTEGALRCCTEALTIAREGSTKDPAQRLSVAQVLLARADLLQSLRDQPGAAKDLEESLAIREELWKSDKQNEDQIRNYTTGLGRAAQLQEQQGDHRAAAATLQRALTMREDVLARDPNARTKRDVANACGALGLLLLRAPTVEASPAHKLLVRQHEMFKDLAEKDPAFARAQDDLTRATVDLADAEAALWGEAQAISRRREAAGMAKSLFEASKGTTRAERRYMLAESLEKLGRAEVELGQPAESSLRASLGHYQALAAFDGKMAAYVDGVARVRELLRAGE